MVTMVRTSAAYWLASEVRRGRCCRHAHWRATAGWRRGTSAIKASHDVASGDGGAAARRSALLAGHAEGQEPYKLPTPHLHTPTVLASTVTL
jgi:hypothetical protein